MHTVTTRLGRVAMAMVAAAAASAVIAAGAEPARASHGPGAGAVHDGSRTDTGYTAGAALLAATGGRPHRTVVPCMVDGPEGGLPAGFEPVEGHYEVQSFDLYDDMYMVFINCVANDPNAIPSHPPAGLFSTFMWFTVPRLDPQEVVERALAALSVEPPVIETSPGDGDPSMVGFDTWLMIDEASIDGGSHIDEQGPIRVEVWAEPDPDGEIVWDTGDGPEVCPWDAADGECDHVYRRSSVGQAGRDADDRPAYGITASVTYTGGYSVSLFGEPIGGDPDLGDITRDSDPYFLAVEDGQALNRRG